MLQQAITSMFETNEKVESPSKEMEGIKKKQRKFRTEKYNNLNEKLTG